MQASAVLLHLITPRYRTRLGKPPGRQRLSPMGERWGGQAREVQGCDPLASPCSAGDALTVNVIRTNAGGIQTQETCSGIGADRELTRTRGK